MLFIWSFGEHNCKIYNGWNDKEPLLYCYISLTISLVNGNWGAWQDWNSCSVTCGSGSRSRYQECNNPEPAFEGSDCQGNDTEIESCSMKLCPGKF